MAIRIHEFGSGRAIERPRGQEPRRPMAKSLPGRQADSQSDRQSELCMALGGGRKKTAVAAIVVAVVVDAAVVFVVLLFLCCWFLFFCFHFSCFCCVCVCLMLFVCCL